MVNKITNPIKPLDVIDKINEIIDDKQIYFGICNTSTGTLTKIVTCENFTLKTGITIKVKFANEESTSYNLKLNVNSTGDIAIRQIGTASTSYNWKSGQIISFTYDGTYWFVDNILFADDDGKFYGLVQKTNTVSSSSSKVLTSQGAYTALNNKQNKLVSGTNIKTINNQSLLGSGNIDIQGGGTITIDSALSSTSENPVQNKVVTQAITELSANVNMDAYLDMIISGNYQDLPAIIQSSYSNDLDDIIGGTYVNV